MIRVELPAHLRTLAQVGREVSVAVGARLEELQSLTLNRLAAL